jgi:hypothetical protein
MQLHGADCGFRPMAFAENGGWRSPKPGMPITETGDGDRLR